MLSLIINPRRKFYPFYSTISVSRRLFLSSVLNLLFYVFLNQNFKVLSNSCLYRSFKFSPEIPANKGVKKLMNDFK
jgi:hypothetical protein